MSRLVGEELPARLFDALRRPSSRTSEAIVLLTVDELGWAHPALLSYGEVSARDRKTIQLDTYGNSRTTANLERDGRVTLVIVNPDMVYHVKGRAASTDRSGSEAVVTTLVDVRQVLEDAPATAEGPASITSGISFRRG
jgi:hypothetical protein